MNKLRTKYETVRLTFFDNQNQGFFSQLQTKTIMNQRIFLSSVLRLTIIVMAFVLINVDAVFAQDTLLVRGTVVNGKNEPVANVAVGVEGSFELPDVTNEAGEFTVKALSGNAWLNIDPPGEYTVKRVFLNNRTELKIFLTRQDIESGYNEVTLMSQQFPKRNLVAAFSSVDMDNILYSTSFSVDKYMQGKVSGLHVVHRSGMPGSGAATFLRGVNSLNAGNEPLYVVDGIPITTLGEFNSNLEGFQHNPLLGVNMLDISEVTVVKDPAITAAYGSKGSNGIVFINTLDPSATETIIEVDLRTGYSLAPETRYPQLNNNQHKTLASELLFSSGKRQQVILEEYPNLYLTEDEDRFIDYQHNTNWQDVIFTDNMFSNVNINVKGGDEIARYGLSFGYVNAKGIIKSTDYDGYNLRFISLLNIFTWLKMNAGVALNYSNAELKESGKVVQTNPILTSLAKSPMLNPYQYDEEGQQLDILANVDELGVSNPQAVIDNYSATNNNFDLTSNLGFQANLRDNLALNTNFGLNYAVLKEKIFMPNRGMELYYGDEAINVSKASNNSLTSFYNNTYLTFNKNFGSDHAFSSITGVNVLNNELEYDWALTKNAHENDEYRMLQDGTFNLREIGGANRTWNWLSFYENLNYVYRDKYIATASVSLDGSSRVGDKADNTLMIGDVPFGLFYSGGLGWRISNESFLKNVSALEELKFRVTYGKSGNDDIGESNATNYYNAVKFRETTGLVPAVVPNNELTYETVSQLNLGMDLALNGYRFTARVDAYRSNIENLLIYAPLEAYFGYQFRPENNGEMQNTGIDLNLFYRIVNGNNFKWDLETWLSTVENKITQVKGEKLVTEVPGAETVNMEGEPANSFYGYIYEGVFSTTEEAQNAGLVNEKLVAYGGGDAKYADISGPNGGPDGVINDFDKTVIGSTLPEFFGGVSNTFHYKRWQLNAFVQFIAGNEVFNYVRYQNERMAGLQNQSTRVLNRWQYEGQVTDVPRAVYRDGIGNSAFSTRWIEDGSYMRLKNVTLSYTIPNEFLTFQNARFYITASNLFTLSEYLGYDPEFAHSFSHVTQGIDYALTPQVRQFMVGVKLGL